MTPKDPSKGYDASWSVESKTDPTINYTVSRRPDGRYACSCPAWKFHAAPKPDCKHIASIIAALGVVRANNEMLQRQIAPRPQTRTIRLELDGVTLAWVTPEQADEIRTLVDGKWRPKPPQPAETAETMTYGDFTIRRKFKL